MMSPRRLLLVAALLWAVAGVNVAVIGGRAALDTRAAWVYAAALPVLLVFRYLIFGPVARKYAARLCDLRESRVAVYRVFSLRGYLVMGFMIAVGAGLRLLQVVPLWFVAFFYLGLGTALAWAGAGFVAAYRRWPVVSGLR